MDRRSEPDFRAVWEDEQLERGASSVWLMRVAQRLSADDDDNAAADAADAVDATDAATRNANTFWRGADMREGLVLIQLPGRYWAVTRVGYAKRITGDEWEFRGVTVTRIDAVRTLADLAANGPGDDHAVSEVDELPELLHRFTPRRVLVASEEAWAKHLKGAKP